MNKYVAYYRVSTMKQGKSSLGLDAQKRMVTNYITPDDDIINQYTEIESGTVKKHRPVLQKAIDKCRSTGAILLIAKVDRLSRSVFFISSLSQSGVDFRCCDMPDANKFTIHIMAAMAENEAEAISSRTKSGLQSIKNKIEEYGFYVTKAGDTIKRLGNPDPGLSLVKAREASSRSLRLKSMSNRNKNVARPYAKELRRNGMYYKDIASRLNLEGYITSQGGKYYPQSVKRLIEEV